VPEPVLPTQYRLFAALLSGEAGESLQLERPLWLTRAPGRLDLLGGPGEVPGTARLTFPLARSVYCAIQNREDPEIHIRSLLPVTWGGSRTWKGEVGTFYTKKGPPRSMAVLRQTFADPKDAWMLRIVAAMLGLRRTRQLNTPRQGFNLVVWSRLPEGRGFGFEAAFGTALSLAFKGATGLARKRVDGVQVARAVILGAREVLGEEIPLTDALTSALGRKGCALMVEYHPDPRMQWIPLPRQAVVAGFHTGVDEASDAAARRAVGVGAAMGLAHLNAFLRKEKKDPIAGWGMVSPTEFENQYRKHVPTKETGADWLRRFRLSAEEIDGVDKEHAYRERALSEHHVRESARVRRMVAQLGEYTRTMREGFLAEAGRGLMSSHRSLAEKCGIRSPDADVFLNTLKALGRRAGFFGGRLTECGACGVVALLVHESAQTDLRKLAEEYRQKQGKGGIVVTQGGDGGLLSVWWEGILQPAPPPKAEPPAAETQETGTARKAGK